LKKIKFLGFYRKTTPYGEILKILFRKDSPQHRWTRRRVVVKFRKKKGAEGKSVKSRIAYLTKKTKFRLTLQLSLLRGLHPKSATASNRECI